MKKAILWLMIFVTLATSLGMAFAADFPDVSSSHPHYTAINFLRNRGIINGYEDGTYKPERSVTRAEFIKIILLSSGHPVLPGDLDRGAFPDVSSSAWYFGFVNRALALGVVSGYPDGTFQPNRTVNRVEALKIMLRTNNINESTLPTGASYTDVSQTEWYAPYARYAMNYHIFDGSRLYPSENMNRGQVAEMVYRFYQARPDLLPASTATPSPTAASPTGSPVPVPMPTSTPTASSTPTVTPSRSFHLSAVTSITASPASYLGACPAWGPVTFSAQVITNGQPGVIAYRWERLDGGHMTNYEVLGIPSAQTSTTISWAPNWDGSIRNAYRLNVMDNGDGTNQAFSAYADFTIDCRAGSPSTTPTATPTSTASLEMLVIGLAYSGNYIHTYMCSPTIQFNFKGSVQTNGVAGTIRYYVEDETGHRGNENTYTLAGGETWSPQLSNSIVYTNTSTDWVKYVRRFVVTPDGQTHNSAPIPVVSNCSSAHAPSVHVVDRANFTAYQEGWGTRYVCGRDNNYTLTGRVYMRQPAAGGDVTYRWTFNTGESSPTMTASLAAGSPPYITLAPHTWTISNASAAGTYTAWLQVLTPNAVTSDSVTITKPRCFSL